MATSQDTMLNAIREMTAQLRGIKECMDTLLVRRRGEMNLATPAPAYGGFGAGAPCFGAPAAETWKKMTDEHGRAYVIHVATGQVYERT